MAHLRDIAIIKDRIYQGGCLCRGVRVCLTDPLRKALICNCCDCFQIAGLSWDSSTSVPDKSFDLITQQTLDWYDSSAWAKRRFCQNCGALLFYRLNGIPQKSVAIGMLDDGSDLVIAGQIFAIDNRIGAG